MGGDKSCTEQAIPAAAAGVFAGVIVGAAASAWKETDLPNKALPMLQSTGGLMARYALLFATVGGVYTGSKCAIDGFRGEKSFVNGAMAGCLTGALVTLKSGRTSAILGGCAAMGVTGAVLEAYNFDIFGIPGYPRGFRQDREKIKAVTTQKEISEN